MLASIAASTIFFVWLGHISVVSDVLVVASYDRARRSFQHHFVHDAASTTFFVRLGSISVVSSFYSAQVNPGKRQGTTLL